MDYDICTDAYNLLRYRGRFYRPTLKRNYKYYKREVLEEQNKQNCLV